MTKLRVLFNNLGVLKTEEVFPKVKSLGIESISFFGHLGGELPKHFESAAKEFKDVCINLFHNPSIEMRRTGGSVFKKTAKKPWP